MFKNNLEKLKQDLNKNNIDLAIITDDDSIYYFTGYFDFLHMSFGRPTILLVPKNSDTVLITPLIDASQQLFTAVLPHNVYTPSVLPPRALSHR